MSAPQMKPVYSSFVDSIGYDGAAQVLYVRYTNGANSTYQKVPPEIADKVMNAASVGGALHEFIRNRFEHSSPKA